MHIVKKRNYAHVNHALKTILSSYSASNKEYWWLSELKIRRYENSKIWTNFLGTKKFISERVDCIYIIYIYIYTHTHTHSLIGCVWCFWWSFILWQMWHKLSNLFTNVLNSFRIYLRLCLTLWGILFHFLHLI